MGDGVGGGGGSNTSNVTSEMWKWAALICPNSDISDARPGKSKAQVENKFVEPRSQLGATIFFGGSVNQLRKRRGPSSGGGGPLARVRTASCFI